MCLEKNTVSLHEVCYVLIKTYEIQQLRWIAALRQKEGSVATALGDSY